MVKEGLSKEVASEIHGSLPCEKLKKQVKRYNNEIHRATLHMAPQRRPIPLDSKIQIIKAKVILSRVPDEEVQTL